VKRELSRAGWDESPPPVVLRGFEEFNRKEFFEAHESIEEGWKAEPRDVRLLWQGILQIGVALYHVERGKWQSAVTMLERGLPKLGPFVPRCQGIDVQAFLEQSERCHAQLRELGPEGLASFDRSLIPRVHCAPPH
jgi:hypothetical protein